MAMDVRARAALKNGEWANLFSYLNGQSTTRQLEILEDLQSQGALVGSFKLDHPAEWNGSAMGDGANRLELSCILVLEKAAGMKTWQSFVAGNGTRFRKLFADWQREMAAFWNAGPRPGLGGTEGFFPLLAGKWKVTDLSVNTVSVVVNAGFTAMTGTVTFSSMSGNEKLDVTRSIGVFGGSLGRSAGALPKALAPASLTKFPNLFNFLFNGETAMGALFDKFYSAATTSAKAYAASLKGLDKALFAQEVIGGASVAKETWLSAAIGPVYPTGRLYLDPGDFKGSCLMMSLQGTLVEAGGGGFGMFFGMNGRDLHIDFSSRRGLALFLAGGVSLQFPQVGAAGSFFWGEII